MAAADTSSKAADAQTEELWAAVKDGEPAAVGAALEQGADASIEIAGDGTTALSIAAERRDDRICEALLTTGVSGDPRRLMPRAQAKLLSDDEQRMWLAGQAEHHGCAAQMVEWLQTYEVPTAHGKWPPVAVRTYEGEIVVVPGRLVRWSGPLQVGAEYDVDREILRCDDSSITWEGMMTALRVFEAWDPVWEWISRVHAATTRAELPARDDMDGLRAAVEAAEALQASVVTDGTPTAEAWRWLLPKAPETTHLKDAKTVEGAWASGGAEPGCNAGKAALWSRWGVLKLLDQIGELGDHIEDSDGDEPVIRWTIARANEELTRRLIDLGADLTKVGWSKVHQAAALGDSAAMTQLIADGADINAPDKEGRTPVWLAAHFGQESIVDQLVAAAVDIQAADDERCTPLHTAVTDGRNAIVKTLIAAGANVDVAPKMGFTAVCEAARRGNLDVVEALIAAGADINKPDEDGNTPLSMAIENDHHDVAACLQAAGAV